MKNVTTDEYILEENRANDIIGCVTAIGPKLADTFDAKWEYAGFSYPGRLELFQVEEDEVRS